MTPGRGTLGATRPQKSAPGAPPKARLGLLFLLQLGWLGLEYGRPTDPMGLPLVISAALLIGFLLSKNKRWRGQSSLVVAFLVVMTIGIPLAANTFSAFWSMYSMATILVCIGLPLPSLVDSVRKIRIWILTFVAVAVYVGMWAILHGGYGPAGAAGGQDENYVGAMMGMAVSFAYFSIFAVKSKFGRIVLAGSILVFLGAMVTAQNVSRGAFIGLCAVILYCLARSPRRLVGFIVIVAVIVVMLPFAGSDYWSEIASIGDANEATADMRLEVWQIGLRMWRANPLLGVGAGNFRWMISQFQSEEQLEKYGRDLGGSIIAHSLFVELLAELGLSGAVVVILLLWSTFRDLGQVIQGSTRPTAGPAPSRDAVALRCYADAVAGATIGCLANGAFLSLLYYSYLWLFVMLGSAIWQVAKLNVPFPKEG